jgi:hypothetical protein
MSAAAGMGSLAAYAGRRASREGGMRLFLRIAGEPGALARVLAPFAVTGHVPHVLLMRPAVRGAAFVVAEFEGPDKSRALLLAEKLRQMPCVLGARFVYRGGSAT